ncbi:TIR domain-containing protein [Roseivirga sp. BDSF3-8]|uniref:TIR domain-containing protein n=1 Tax=Roseivirga sp. BDSF3-8 TaxID=3241598 RepID=UPI003531CA9A
MVKHKVFISFHHGKDSEKEGGSLYRTAFENHFGNIFSTIVTQSIHDGDIDPDLPEKKIKELICKHYIKDTKVTIVMIGPHTYGRKYVDWEISASLRSHPDGYPSGILGIILPDHKDFLKEDVDHSLLPPRLADNLATGFASLHHWTFDPSKMAEHINGAVQKRKTFYYDDSRPLLSHDLDTKERVDAKP